MKRKFALLLTLLCLLVVILPGCQRGGRESSRTGPDLQSEESRGSSEGETAEEIISDAYRVMEMELAES